MIKCQFPNCCARLYPKEPRAYFVRSSVNNTNRRRHQTSANISSSTRLELGLCQLHFTKIELYQPISGRVDRASASETVDASSITGQVKLNTIEIGIHNFPDGLSAL